MGKINESLVNVIRKPVYSKFVVLKYSDVSGVDHIFNTTINKEYLNEIDYDFEVGDDRALNNFDASFYEICEVFNLDVNLEEEENHRIVEVLSISNAPEDLYPTIISEAEDFINESLVNVKKKKVEYHGDFPNGKWEKIEYNDKGRVTYWENFKGEWEKWGYDDKGNQTYYENSDGDWEKTEYDNKGNAIYYENAKGKKYDNRNQINESISSYRKPLLEHITKNSSTISEQLSSIGLPREVISNVIKETPKDLATYLLTVLNLSEIKKLINEDTFKCGIDEIEKKAKKIIFAKYNWNPADVLFTQSDNAVHATMTTDLRSELQTPSNDQVIFAFLKKLSASYEKDLNKEYSTFCGGLSFMRKRSTTVNSSAYSYTVILVNNEIYRYDSNGEKRRLKHGNNPKYQLNKLYIELGLFSHNVVSESLVNVKSKQYPTKIEGDYPNGFWTKTEFDKNGKEIYFEDSNGYWSKWEYDENGNKTYWETSEGYWSRREYDENGNEIYFENSHGDIRNNRPQVNESLVNVTKKIYEETLDEQEFYQKYDDDICDMWLKVNKEWLEDRIGESSDYIRYRANLVNIFENYNEDSGYNYDIAWSDGDLELGYGACAELLAKKLNVKILTDDDELNEGLVNVVKKPRNWAVFDFLDYDEREVVFNYRLPGNMNGKLDIDDRFTLEELGINPIYFYQDYLDVPFSDLNNYTEVSVEELGEEPNEEYPTITPTESIHLINLKPDEFINESLVNVNKLDTPEKWLRNLFNRLEPVNPKFSNGTSYIYNNTEYLRYNPNNKSLSVEWDLIYEVLKDKFNIPREDARSLVNRMVIEKFNLDPTVVVFKSLN